MILGLDKMVMGNELIVHQIHLVVVPNLELNLDEINLDTTH